MNTRILAMASHRFDGKMRVMVTALLAALALVTGCGPSADGDPNAIKIGLLLPFTGADSATSRNFEQAVLYARDRINEGGGIQGRHVQVVSADTHSDPARAGSSVETLVSAGALAVVGVESAEIAAEIKPILDARAVVFVSPLVGAADDRAVDCTVPWFRLAPSANAMGEALAKLAFAGTLTKAAVLHSDGAYDEALRRAFESRFVSLGGTIVFRDALARDAHSYAASISGALAAQADNVLLAVSPRSAAIVANELSILSASKPQLFLSPLLKTDAMLQNVMGDALEGATGVTPKIFDTSNHFPVAFEERWLGDPPLDGAYFYYDAVAMLSFALAKAAYVNGTIDAAGIRAAVPNVTGASGEAAGWNEIPVSLKRLGAGQPIFYTGLSGPVLLNACGDRLAGASSVWQVRAGKIVVTAL
jgi:ABC-type branched-subunit amino acid transport system substrate-binding protein